MSKLVKSLEYAALEKTFTGVRSMLLITPTKVDAALDINFRKTLRDQKISVKMVKNSLTRKIFDAQGVTVDAKHWAGTTLVAWGGDSIKGLSKAVDTLIKAIEKKDPKAKDKLTVKAAVADGQTVSMKMAMEMPTRLEAIGEIMAMILGPASEIAAALTGPASQIASQLTTLAERKEDAAPAPAAAESPAAAEAPAATTDSPAA